MNVSQLLVKLRLDNSQFNTGMEQSRSKLRGMDTQAKGLMDSMKFAGLMGMAFMGRQIVSTVIEMGKLGAKSEQVQASFEELARQAGGSATEMLAAIKRASGGTVSEMDAMLAANKGILLGLGAQADQWEKLTEVARFRARAMGISMTQAIADISMGIGRESRLILDNLGIILDMDRITGNYAKTLGKTADQLTVFERKQAIMNAVITEGQVQIRAAGGIVDDTGDKIERSSTAWANFKDKVGRLLDEPIADFLAELGTFATRLQLQADAFELASTGAISYADALKMVKDIELMPAAELPSAVAAMEEMKAGDLELMAADREAAAARETLAQAQADYTEALEGGYGPLIELAGAVLENAEANLLAAQTAELAAKAHIDLAQAQAEAEARGRGWHASLVENADAESALLTAFHNLKAAQAEYTEALTRGSSAQIFFASAAVSAAQAAYDEAVGAAEAARATRELAAAADSASGGVGGLSARLGSAMRHLSNYTGQIKAFTSALDEVQADLNKIDAVELGTGFGSAADQLSTHLSRLSTHLDLGQAQEIYSRYLAQLEDLYREAAEVTARGGRMTELELMYRREKIIAAFDAELGVIEDSIKDQDGALNEMARQYSDLRGIVASALQPTEVTGLDMEMAALGTYVDKWDESARRLEAIAARGFAELKAHPDWAAALKIPEGVLSGSEEALKGWARRTANDVRSLFRPDLLDIDAAADAVEEYMREMAAREVTIDLVIKELQTRGVSEEQARKQVLEMYGLEQELPISLGLAPGAVESLIGGIGTVTLPVELAEATAALPGEEGAPPSLGLVEGALSSVEDQAGDLYGAGERAARHLSDGFTVTMAGLAFGGPLLSHLEGEMKAQQESLAEIGGSLWITIERGFRHGMQRSSLLREFVEEVLSLVLQRLARSETFGGGSGTP